MVSVRRADGAGVDLVVVSLSDSTEAVLAQVIANPGGGQASTILKIYR